MKKMLPLFLVFALVMSVGCMKKAAVSSADGVNVGATMLKIGAEFGALNVSYVAKNFVDCEKRFLALAEYFKTLSAVSPKVGTKLEWDAIHKTIILTCKAGATAAKMKNGDGVGSSIEALKSSMMTGHKIFKK